MPHPRKNPIRILCILCVLLALLITNCKSNAKLGAGIVYVRPKENVNGLIILGSDLQLAVRFQKLKSSERLPYSPNASGAIWIGKDFPLDKAPQMILWSKKYYSGLRYVAFTKDLRHKLRGKGKKTPKVADKSMLIGGQTHLAVAARLRAWQRKDFRKLKSIKKEKDFRKLVESHYDRGLSKELQEWAIR